MRTTMREKGSDLCLMIRRRRKTGCDLLDGGGMDRTRRTVCVGESGGRGVASLRRLVRGGDGERSGRW